MRKIAAFLLFVVLVACYNDTTDIVVNGTISDAQTDDPIPNARIKVTCWIYGNTPDGSYTDKIIKKLSTNKNGKYECQCEKGAMIHVEVFAEGYRDGFAKQEAYNRKNTINVKLDK